jgi:hypothetical protein
MTELLHESPPTGAPLANLPAVPELTQLMVHLLRGVLYREDDERLWASLFRLQARVREQTAVLLCPRRPNFDPPCRSNIGPGMDADRWLVSCG